MTALSGCGSTPHSLKGTRNWLILLCSFQYRACSVASEVLRSGTQLAGQQKYHHAFCSQDEEKRKESLEMFEESSKQGCLNSSYLLWESNRKAAVSSIFLSQNNFFTLTSGCLLRAMKIHRKKLLFLGTYLLHKQGEC